MILIFLNILLFTGYIFEIKINFFHFDKFGLYITFLSNINLVIFIFIVYKFFLTVKNFQQEINKGYAVNEVVHEILLTTDSFKISFNYFMIKYKINKIIPNILYKKDSYYFTTLNKGNKADNKLEKKLKNENKNCSNNSENNLDSTCYRTYEFEN